MKIPININTYRLSLLVLLNGLVGSIGKVDLRAQLWDDEVAGSNQIKLVNNHNHLE